MDKIDASVSNSREVMDHFLSIKNIIGPVLY